MGRFMKKKESEKVTEEIESTRKKLLFTAATLFVLTLLYVVFLYNYEDGKLLRTSNNIDKYSNETAEELDTRDYPGNISTKLQNKLRTLSEDAVVRVYVGNMPVPLEMSKSDILHMAEVTPSLSFDLE